MGQVPRKEHYYGIVGNGRVAKHLSHYFNLEKIPYKNWNRSDHNDEDVAKYFSACSVICILISDSSIEQFISKHLARTNKQLIHCSGVLSIAGTIGLHPLMSFTEELYSLDQYRSIPFVIDDKGIRFHDLFPSLRNPSYQIERKDKNLYHALSVMAGNFSVILWQKLFSDFSGKLGLPKAAALPYMNSIFQNLTINPETALTGPLVRDDHETMSANIVALENDPYQIIYKSFVETFHMEKNNEHS